MGPVLAHVDSEREVARQVFTMVLDLSAVPEDGEWCDDLAGGLLRECVHLRVSQKTDPTAGHFKASMVHETLLTMGESDPKVLEPCSDPRRALMCRGWRVADLDRVTSHS